MSSLRCDCLTYLEVTPDDEGGGGGLERPGGGGGFDRPGGGGGAPRGIVGLGGGFLLELGRELEGGGGGALGEPDRS